MDSGRNMDDTFKCFDHESSKRFCIFSIILILLESESSRKILNKFDLQTGQTCIKGSDK